MKYENFSALSTALGSKLLFGVAGHPATVRASSTVSKKNFAVIVAMRVLMKFHVRVVAALDSTYDKANVTETSMFCSRSEQMSEPVKKIAKNTPLADIYYCEKTAMPGSQGGESKED